MSDVSVTSTECICNGLIFLCMKAMPNVLRSNLALSQFEFSGFSFAAW